MNEHRILLRSDAGAAILIVISILTLISIVGVSFVYYADSGYSAVPGTTTDGEIRVWSPDRVVARLDNDRTATIPPRPGRLETTVVVEDASAAEPLLAFTEIADRTGEPVFSFLAPDADLGDAYFAEANDVPAGVETLEELVSRLEDYCRNECPPAPRIPCDCTLALELIDAYLLDSRRGPIVALGSIGRFRPSRHHRPPLLVVVLPRP